MTTVPFAKLHGLGNDFLVLDARDADTPEDPGGPGRALLDACRADAGLAARVCDRHRGVGADGLLFVRGTLRAPAMVIVNVDGTEPEMCGNGIRCVARWLGDRHLPRADALVIETGNGPLACGLERDAAGHVARVRVDMGPVSDAPGAVGLAGTERAPWRDRPLRLDSYQLHVTALSLGNPHAVVFTPLSAEGRTHVGPRLTSHPLFAAGVNAELVRTLPPGSDGRRRFEVHVHERGCGWTQACGTGATAVGIAAVWRGDAEHDAPIDVRLPGGWLTIEVSREADGRERAFMTGPAAWAYDGVLPLAAYRAEPG